MNSCELKSHIAKFVERVPQIMGGLADCIPDPFVAAYVQDSAELAQASYEMASGVSDPKQRLTEVDAAITAMNTCSCGIIWYRNQQASAPRELTLFLVQAETIKSCLINEKKAIMVELKNSEVPPLFEAIRQALSRHLAADSRDKAIAATLKAIQKHQS